MVIALPCSFPAMWRDIHLYNSLGFSLPSFSFPGEVEWLILLVSVGGGAGQASLSSSYLLPGSQLPTRREWSSELLLCHSFPGWGLQSSSTAHE